MNLKDFSKLLLGGVAFVVTVILAIVVLGSPLWIALAWWFDVWDFQITVILLLVLAVYSSAM